MYVPIIYAIIDYILYGNLMISWGYITGGWAELFGIGERELFRKVVRLIFGCFFCDEVST